MKSHIIGFLLVTLAQIPMPIKIGTTFQNKLRPIVGNDSIYGAVIILLNSPTKFMNAPYIRAPRFSAVFACLEFPRADGRQLMQQRRFLAQ